MSEIQKILDVIHKITDINHPIIVDVGANNTAPFSEKFIKDGKKCLLIEPQFSCYQNLRKLYSECANVSIVRTGCGNKNTKMKLFHGKKHDEHATFNINDSPWFSEVRDDSYEIVPCKTLTTILEELEWDSIDILKIDCESWDPYVIEGINFTKYRPEIIVTEEYSWEVDMLVKKYQILEDNQYVLLGYIGYNSLWKRKEHDTRWINFILPSHISGFDLGLNRNLP